ncbi:MAG: non-canonical purine NTP diphosphatase [Chlorobi bacterium]|nr:non-canonical purine NTP diphosphatase [Chlorobiota bacterium]
MQLVFATNNKNKLQEIKNLLNNDFKLLGLKELGFEEEIPEDKFTLEENALQKAHFIHQKYKVNCFADDTGLEVEALNNQPGVFSARYAGPQKNSNDNIVKLLKEMQPHSNRKARFRTIVALILNDKEYLFEGIVNGKIANEKRGTSGFGYDPVFIPDGHKKTFAELSLDEKNIISHRARAFQKLIGFLKRN